MSDDAPAVKLCLVSPSPPQSSLGRYGGASGDERQARRREQLLAAGLEVFGTVGYPASTVKAICAQAELTERYFYESFQDREDLLLAVFDWNNQYVMTAALAASEASEPTVEARARAGLGTWFRLLTEDVRRAKINSLETVGVSASLERRRREVMHAFAAYFVDVAMKVGSKGRKPIMDPEIVSMALVGATNELLIDWVHGTITKSADEVVEHLVRLFVATAELVFEE